MLSFTITKNMIQKTISHKLPIKDVIEVKNNLPDNLSFLDKYLIDPSFLIDNIEVDFKDNYALFYVYGVFSLNKSYPFLITIKGQPYYKEGKFYFKGDNFSVDTEKDLVLILKDFIVEQTSENKIVGSITSFINKMHSKYGPSDEELKDNKLSKYIVSKIEEKIIDFLKNNHIYELDDSFAQRSIKKLLKDISVSEKGILVGIGKEKKDRND